MAQMKEDNKMTASSAQFKIRKIMTKCQTSITLKANIWYINQSERRAHFYWIKGFTYFINITT